MPKTSGTEKTYGNSNNPKPILKWVGGKSQLLSVILKHIPKNFNHFHEPFLGGAALFFALYRQGLITQQAFLTDINDELIATYTAIKNQPHQVISELQKHRYNKDYYYKIRNLEPINLTKAQAAARMIFLNRTGFNGLYRVNKKGKFNVPFGRYKNPVICNQQAINAASKAFHLANLSHAHFKEVIQRSKPGDFVYFDPPYVPLSQTSNFVNYAQYGFSLQDQQELANVFMHLSKKKVFVMLSNSSHNWVKKTYKDFYHIELSARRSINCNSTKRGPVKELLIVNYNEFYQ